jgi:hypothetical protein
MTDRPLERRASHEPPGDERSPGRDASRGESAGEQAKPSPTAPPSFTEEEVARLQVALEQSRHDQEVLRELKTRLKRELSSLDRRVVELEGERDSLLARLSERDRVLDVMKQSRSWRWTQALRRLLGRR